jgi:subtilase family serine protease
MKAFRSHLVEPLERRALLTADISAAVEAAMPDAAIGGEKVKGSAIVTVTNTGDETARGRTPVELYLSLDHSFDVGDTLLKTSSAKLRLEAGKSKNVKFKLRSFPVAPAGAYHLIALVNSDAAIPDTVAENNIAVDEVHHVELEPPMRDLSAAFNTVPEFARLGKSVTVLVDVGNIGNLPAKGKISFSIAASTDTTADPIGTPIAVARAKVNVPINDVATAKVKFRIPSTLPAGTYFLIGTVDSTNVVAETDETNNPFQGFTTITVG